VLELVHKELVLRARMLGGRVEIIFLTKRAVVLILECRHERRHVELSLPFLLQPHTDPREVEAVDDKQTSPAPAAIHHASLDQRITACCGHPRPYRWPQQFDFVKKKNFTRSKAVRLFLPSPVETQKQSRYTEAQCSTGSKSLKPVMKADSSATHVLHHRLKLL
jgi:hypothetical protein